MPSPYGLHGGAVLVQAEQPAAYFVLAEAARKPVIPLALRLGDQIPRLCKSLQNDD